MTRLIRSFILLLVLIGVGQAVPVSAQNTQPPANFPANLRWDLVPKWMQWDGTKVTISWPPNDGCAAAPEARTLAAGEMIDRFGSEGGTFFSPKGELFRARAVPYVCGKMDYRVYRVERPLPTKACKAAPWFGEPGGAVQVQTAEPAYKLVSEGWIVAVTNVPAGAPGPEPQCAGSPAMGQPK